MPDLFGNHIVGFLIMWPSYKGNNDLCYRLMMFERYYKTLCQSVLHYQQSQKHRTLVVVVVLVHQLTGIVNLVIVPETKVLITQVIIVCEHSSLIVEPHGHLPVPLNKEFLLPVGLVYT